MKGKICHAFIKFTKKTTSKMFSSCIKCKVNLYHGKKYFLNQSILDSFEKTHQESTKKLNANFKAFGCLTF